MSKNQTKPQAPKADAKPAATVAAPATVTPQGTAKPQIISAVKAGVKYRGARAAWYTVLQAHQGKPAADFLAACTTKPPSLPESGVAEKPSGWLRFFVRSGIATLT